MTTALKQLGRTDGAPFKLSEAEAHAVWSRAALLQANTGMDRRYVDRTVAEREPAAVAVRPGAQQRKIDIFTGAPSHLEYETTVPGDLYTDAFEVIADAIRRLLVERVTVSSVGRTLTVQASVTGGGRRSTPRQLQIHVSSRGGVTRLLALANLEGIAGKTFGSGLGAIGGGGSVMGMLMSATQHGGIALSVWGGWIAITYVGARLRYRALVKERDAQLRRLLEQVARLARKNTRS